MYGFLYCLRPMGRDDEDIVPYGQASQEERSVGAVSPPARMENPVGAATAPTNLYRAKLNALDVRNRTSRAFLRRKGGEGRGETKK